MPPVSPLLAVLRFQKPLSKKTAVSIAGICGLLILFLAFIFFFFIIGVDIIKRAFERYLVLKNKFRQFKFV